MMWLPLLLSAPFGIYAVFCLGVLHGRQEYRNQMRELEKKDG